jgi:proline dehydrogenase
MQTAVSSFQKIKFDNLEVAFASRSNADLRKMRFLFGSMASPTLVKAGTWMIATALKLGIPVKALVKPTLFDHFCGGETIQDCDSTIQKLHNYKVGTILDYSVEGEKSEQGFDKTADEIIATIRKASSRPAAIPFSVFKVTGVADAELLQIIQEGKKLSPEQEASWQKAKERIRKICAEAYNEQVRIFIDAEETWIQEPIDALAYEMMQLFNQERAIVYNTFQLYRSDVLANLKKAYHYATMHNYWLGAKLVRGAYMEKERKRATDMGYASPIQPDKASTDRDFDLALRFCLDNKQRIAICAGTHNEQSTNYLLDLMDKYNVRADDPNIFFAQLYGMSDNISYALAKQGYNVAKYVPYGPVQKVLPYLFRRAEENTSVAGQTSRELLLIKGELKRRSQA